MTVILGLIGIYSYVYIMHTAHKDHIKINDCIKCFRPTFFKYHPCSRCDIDRERLSGLESEMTMRQSEPDNERSGD